MILQKKKEVEARLNQIREELKGEADQTDNLRNQTRVRSLDKTRQEELEKLRRALQTTKENLEHLAEDVRRTPDLNRLSESMRDLVPRDSDRRWSAGSGAPVEITGSLRDIAAWLAGRVPANAVKSSAGELPELGPWPSALLVK